MFRELYCISNLGNEVKIRALFRRRPSAVLGESMRVDLGHLPH